MRLAAVQAAQKLSFPIEVFEGLSEGRKVISISFYSGMNGLNDDWNGKFPVELSSNRHQPGKVAHSNGLVVDHSLIPKPPQFRISLVL
jgi:hypothetical protein